MADLARTIAASVTAMYQRQECIAHASACREKAQFDLAQHDYSIDEAVVSPQRAVEARHQNAVTHEIRDGRVLPKDAR
jgi:hypothetical protein